VVVEELPEKLLPENDVVIELVEVIPEGASSVGGVGVAPCTKTTSCKSSPRVWIVNIGVQEGRWREKTQVKAGAKMWCFDRSPKH